MKIFFKYVGLFFSSSPAASMMRFMCFAAVSIALYETIITFATLTAYQEQLISNIFDCAFKGKAIQSIGENVVPFIVNKITNTTSVQSSDSPLPPEGV